MLFKQKMLDESVIKTKFLAGVIDENTYQELLEQINENYNDQNKIHNKTIESSLEEIVNDSLEYLDNKINSNQINENDFVV